MGLILRSSKLFLSVFLVMTVASLYYYSRLIQETFPYDDSIRTLKIHHDQYFISNRARKFATTQNAMKTRQLKSNTNYTTIEQKSKSTTISSIQINQRPIVFFHFHKSGGTDVCFTIGNASSILNLTGAWHNDPDPDAQQKQIRDKYNCNAPFMGPHTDARLNNPDVKLTCAMLLPYTTSDDGIPFQRNNFMAVEIPLNHRYPCHNDCFRNFAVMRHPIDRVLSHMKVRRWTEEYVLHRIRGHEEQQQMMSRMTSPASTTNVEPDIHRKTRSTKTRKRSSFLAQRWTGRNTNEFNQQDQNSVLLQRLRLNYDKNSDTKKRKSNPTSLMKQIIPCINNMVIRQLLGYDRFLDITTPITDQDLKEAKEIVAHQFQVFVPTSQQWHPRILSLFQQEIPEYYHALLLRQQEKQEGQRLGTAIQHKHNATQTYSKTKYAATAPLDDVDIHYDPSAQFLQVLYEQNKYDLLLYEFIHEHLGLLPYRDKWKDKLQIQDMRQREQSYYNHR